MKKQTKWFNALDVLICLVVCAAAVVIAVYFGGSAGSPIMASNNKTVYFTVEAISLQPGFHEKITVGDPIEDSAKGYYYGTVSDVVAEPTVVETLDAVNGKIVQAEVPNRETVLLTVKCDGTESDTAVTAGGQLIKIGKKMTLKGKGYALSGFILEMWTE